jgi:hypothetical protein
MQSTKSIYLEDTNTVKYYCYTNEITQAFLKINQGSASQLKFKFMRTYSSLNKNVSLVLSDIILNYNGSVNENTSRETVTLEL